MLTVLLVRHRVVNGSNPGVVKYFSTSLSFESNSSDVYSVMFNAVNRWR